MSHSTVAIFLTINSIGKISAFDTEKLEAEKLAKERLALEKLANQKLAANKIANEKLANESPEAEKLAKEKLEAEKLATEKLEAEKLANAKLVVEKPVMIETKSLGEVKSRDKATLLKSAVHKAKLESFTAHFPQS